MMQVKMKMEKLRLKVNAKEVAFGGSAVANFEGITDRRKKEKEKMIKKTMSCLLIMGYVFCSLTFVPHASASVRIKDVAHFQGVRDNQLIGYGLVVGLNGSGDKSQSVFTVKSIASLLNRVGVEVKESEISPKNVAAVMITATLPPFIKPGARIDVTLSSLGDASSLKGGTLLLTPLEGADNVVYAVAQGPVSIGGFDPSARGGGTFETVGRIPQGALIERAVPVSLINEGAVQLSLKQIDFTTCVRVAEAINISFGDTIAAAIDGATIEVRIPDVYMHNTVQFFAKIEHIKVEPDAIAKIIVNERTGTIVGGKEVKISRVSVTHKDINIEIKPENKQTVSEEELGEERTSSFAPHEEGLFTEGEKIVPVVLEEETTIGEVAQILNTVGVRPADLIAIFQAIKEAGAIQATLEII